MRFDSMIYTMGTALNHALDMGIPVRILICGQWIDGRVLSVDGHGVILEGIGGTHAVIKVTDISAVQVMSEAPVDTPQDVSAQFEAITSGKDLVVPRTAAVA